MWCMYHSKTHWVSETPKRSYSRVKFHGSLFPWWIFYFLLSFWKRNFLGFLFPPTVLQWQGCFLSRAAPLRPLHTDSPPPLSLSFKHLIHLEADLVQKISLTFAEPRGFSAQAQARSRWEEEVRLHTSHTTHSQHVSAVNLQRAARDASGALS